MKRSLLSFMTMVTMGIFFAFPVLAYELFPYTAITQDGFGSNAGRQEFRLNTTTIFTDITIALPSTSSCYTGSSCQLGIYQNASIMTYANFSASSSKDGFYFSTFNISGGGSTTTLQANTNYWLNLPINAMVAFGSSTYTNSSQFDKHCNYSSLGTCNLGYNYWDVWFAWNSNGYFLSTNTNTISFVNTDLVKPDFQAWALSYNLINYPNDTTAISVYWGITNTLMENVDTRYIINETNRLSGASLSYGNFLIPKTRSISPNTIIYAKAYLLNGISILTSTPIIEIAITAGTKTTSNATTSTRSLILERLLDPFNVDTNFASSGENGFEFACNPDDPFFYRSMCHMFVFLFKPLPESLDNFTVLKETLKKKPPFGYIENIITTVSSTINTTSSTSSTYSNTTTLAFLDNDFKKFPIYSYIYNIFTYSIWIGLLIYMYKRFKHFNPHG